MSQAEDFKLLMADPENVDELIAWFERTFACCEGHDGVGDASKAVILYTENNDGGPELCARLYAAAGKALRDLRGRKLVWRYPEKIRMQNRFDGGVELYTRFSLSGFGPAEQQTLRGVLSHSQPDYVGD